MTDEDINLDYEEAVLYAWDCNFNRKKWSNTFLAIVIGGGIITMGSIVYTMGAGNPAGPTKADAVAYGFGAMGIVAVAMSILGLYAILLSESALVTALRVAKRGFADTKDLEIVEPTSSNGAKEGAAP